MSDAAKMRIGEAGYERVEGDRYWTEPWVTKTLLDGVLLRGWIWECAAGRGDMADVFRGAGCRVVCSDIAGSSLGCESASELDFLTAEPPAGWPAVLSIVTNPPYLLAEQFIRRALKLTQPEGGMVAMLLRNEYDCAARRRDLFEREPFRIKLVLTKRPRWSEQNTASPRHNFAWYVWDHQYSGSPEIGWLP